MTSTQRPRPPRQTPNGGAPVQLGIILVVVAVVLGVILLAKGGGIGYDNDSKDVKIGTGNKDETPAETKVTTSSVPTTSVAPAELKVAVLNAAGVNGFAGKGSNFLSLAGYPAVTAGNAKSQVTTTSVYYSPGFEGDARAVAKLLSVGDVQPLPSEALGKTAADVPEGTAVVVVLGPDVQGIIVDSSANTTTTEAGGATSGGSSGSETGSSASNNTIPAQSSGDEQGTD